MQKFIIKGTTKLEGEVTISGAKNSALAILPAIILIDGPCKIENIPDILDVKIMLNILKSLGAKIDKVDQSTAIIDTTNITSYEALSNEVSKIRASYYLIGALLAKFKRATVAFPGGCNFGTRPIDQHLKAFEALGSSIDLEHGNIYAYSKNEKLTGSHLYMDIVSVGATINAILAATKAEGLTIIENAAKEPHIVDLANFLNRMGADIRGAGTDVIKIRGVEKLTGGTYSIIPDQIEAGTFMIASALTKGDVTIKNCTTKHMDSLTAKLVEMGAKIHENDAGDILRIIADKKLSPTSIQTQPYPGFPTDLQPQMTTLLSVSNGTSTVTEAVWDSRFQYISELGRMGANIKVEGRIAIITGVDHLTGAKVTPSDLRAGAALLLAGISAKGTTEIININTIARGYENIEQKFNSIGANIQTVDCTDYEII